MTPAVESLRGIGAWRSPGARDQRVRNSLPRLTRFGRSAAEVSVTALHPYRPHNRSSLLARQVQDRSNGSMNGPKPEILRSRSEFSNITRMIAGPRGWSRCSAGVMERVTDDKPMGRKGQDAAVGSGNSESPSIMMVIQLPDPHLGSGSFAQLTWRVSCNFRSGSS